MDWPDLSAGTRRSYMLANRGKGRRGRKRELVAIQELAKQIYQEPNKHTHTQTHTHTTNTHTHTNTCAQFYVCMYIYIYIYIYLFVYLFIYLFMYLYL